MKLCDQSCQAGDVAHLRSVIHAVRARIHEFGIDHIEECQGDDVCSCGALGLRELLQIIGGKDPASTQPVSDEVVGRVKNAVEFAKQRRYLAAAIDIPDLEALLVALGAK